MAMFRAFKPSGMEKIARAMGYQGNMQGFTDYLTQDPMRQQQMQRYADQAIRMAKGGVVRKMQTGGLTLGAAVMPNYYNPQTGQTYLNKQAAPDPSVLQSYNLPSGPGAGGNMTAEQLQQANATPGAPADYSGMTYELAQTRQAQRDVKSAEEQAAINAALQRGPSGVNNPLTQAYVPTQEYKEVDKPKLDTNQFLADGTTPNPNYMRPMTDPDGNVITEMQAPDITDMTAQRFQTPGLPTGGAVTAQGVALDPSQQIAAGTGQVSGAVAIPTAQAATTFAQAPTETEANVMQATTASGAVGTAMDAVQAAEGTVDPQAQVIAAQQTATSVGSVTAAQGNATLMNNPTQRQIQQGELVSGAADAQKAAQFTEQIQAAQATPSQKATVQGQLQDLMMDFQGGATPPWASGAMRAAAQAMAARGLGASSLAGQAAVQAAMESALPIAQADAAIQSQFEAQNLSNRQQRAMLAAEQRAKFIGQEFDQAFQARVQNASRIADVANMNFTAEQQVALENSRIANSMNLANLSNKQAVVMAEAAALAQMDMANLNNRQQAAVMNAQNFMQMDLANLSNRQQTEIFTAQQRTQALFTDQAALNAAAQFNASSQNQVDQFFANLSNNVSQFNATQANAQSQYNAGQRNVVERFNAELNNQRDQFNAQNQMVIAQSNAQWRREVATMETAAVNRANEINAQNVLNVSNQAYANLWQFYGDSMEWAWTSAENAQDRISAMAIAELDADAREAIAQEQASGAAGSAIGSLIGTLGSAWILSCWVAREVYGKRNIEWYIFRTWLEFDSPKWFKDLYIKHGEAYAKFISNKPVFKWLTKKVLDGIVESKRKACNVRTV